MKILSLILLAALASPALAESRSSCKPATTSVKADFRGEVELKDLITWAMSFTCKNFLLDPRIISNKKATVLAPATMSPADAYNLFVAALSTMGLAVVPKGDNVLRIVEASAVTTASMSSVSVSKS